MVGRGRRHPWQDHHHQPDRRRAGSGQARPHRHQRRHHQRLWLQHPPRPGRVDGGGSRRERRQLPAPAGGDRGGHQHGPRAPGPLGHAGGDGRRLRPVRRQHPLLRLRRALHRPSGGAADDPPPRRSAHRHLRLQPAGRCARRGAARRFPRRHLPGGGHRPGAQPHPPAGAVPAADAGPAQRAERARRRRGGGRDDDRRRYHPLGLRRVRRREAPLHPHRRGGRNHRDRRLRPPPGGDRRGAARRPPGRGEDRGGGGAAAPVLAPAIALRRVLRLHERRLHGHRGGCLSGRGGTDPGGGPRRAGGGLARARPSRRGAARRAGAAGGDDLRDRPAGRLRGLPGRRQHHPMGADAAGGAGGVAGAGRPRRRRCRGRCRGRCRCRQGGGPARRGPGGT